MCHFGHMMKNDQDHIYIRLKLLKLFSLAFDEHN